MDARAAVQTAKQYIADLFEGEPLINVGLEEVVYEDGSHEWDITISFSRDWNRTSPFFPSKDEASQQRYYKRITIDDDTGEVQSLTDRVTTV